MEVLQLQDLQLSSCGIQGNLIVLLCQAVQVLQGPHICRLQFDHSLLIAHALVYPRISDACALECLALHVVSCISALFAHKLAHCSILFIICMRSCTCMLRMKVVESVELKAITVLVS